MDAMTVEFDAPATTITGTVTGVEGEGVRVWTEDGAVVARRAVSCLVTPEPGDLVLLARAAGAAAYVLSVLERPHPRGTRIAVEGDLTLELPAGRFGVHAADGIELASGKSVSVAADTLEARARDGSLFVGSVRLIAGTVESVAERVCQTAKRVFRRVDELDRLRAGRIDHAAERTARLHGEHTLITARELVKADGKQIHIG